MPIMRLVQMMAAAGAEKAFRFTIVTTAPNETFTPPFEITGTYDCNINWGDGSNSDITVWNHADVTHSYATPGTHEIAITGTVIGWRFNNGGDCAKYYETKSWGPLRLGNSNGYFYGCSNLTITATDILDLTGTTTLSSMFRSCISLTTIPSINSWDVSLVTDPTVLFYNAKLFNQEISGFLGALDVTDVQYMLYDCDAFNQGVSSLDTSRITNMTATFSQMVSFDQDLSTWDISSLANASFFLDNTTLSVANYDALILSWGPQAQTIVANFHGGNSKYTGGGAVEAARDAWIAKGWTITDGGIAP